MYNESNYNIFIKTINYISITLILVIFITACNNNSGPVPAAIKEDSSLNAKTSTMDSNRIQTISADSLDSDSKNFIIEAATSNSMEIMKAKAALSNATDPALKDFSKTIVDEHTQLNIKLDGIAQSKNISLPKTFIASQQKEIEVLTNRKGKYFDTTYVNDMIENIKSDIEYYTKASKSLEDKDSRKYAADALPILLKDLDALKAIKTGL
ncbi:MAG: DUF4142 domain-containing protein [Ginsengibacter sp.]